MKLDGHLAAYRRGAAGKLTQVWSASDGALPLLVANCRKVAQRELLTASR